MNTNIRLFDLVRFMRSELHEADLITDDEYFWLCSEAEMANSPTGGSPSPRRLEDYDELRGQLTAQAAQIAQLREALERIRAILQSTSHPHEALAITTESLSFPPPPGRPA